MVLLINNKNGIAELVAFTEIEEKFEPQNLSQFLINRLPAYMVPKRFVKVNSLPRNDRGKVARDEVLKGFL